MINGKLVRVNELQHITARGFVVKLHADEKMPAEWPGLLNEFETTLKSAISDEKSRMEVQLLQFNTYNRGAFQVPACEEFPDLNSIMRHCVNFCSRVNSQKSKQVTYFAGRLDLEQAFLAYASYQQDNDAARN